MDGKRKIKGMKLGQQILSMLEIFPLFCNFLYLDHIFCIKTDNEN